MMETPTVEQAEMIIEAMYDLGFAGSAEVREDYSGRGMYGSTCVAITGEGGSDSYLQFAMGFLVGQGELPDESISWFTRLDQMGLGWVRY